MSNIKIKKIDSTPKLINGFGEVFDYKNSDLANMAVEKIHQKKLNLEREISKLRAQKKLEKNNFYKFKNTRKTTYLSEKAAIKLKYKSEKTKFKEILKNCSNLIPLESFIETRIKNLKKEIKNNFVSAKKTLNSIQYSDETESELEVKTKAFRNVAISKEELLIKYREFLVFVFNKKLSFTKEQIFNNQTMENLFTSLIGEFKNTFSSNSNYKFYSNNISLNDKNISDKDSQYFLSDLKKILKAYKSQSYFIYNNQYNNIKDKLIASKQNFSTSISNCKTEYKNSIKDYQLKINNKYKDGYSQAKEEFDQEKNEIKSNLLKEEAKQLQKELLNRQKLRKKEIKEIKKEELTKYKNKVANCKKNKGANQELPSNLKIPFDIKFSIKNWKYKNQLSNIKAQYLVDLGKRLEGLTYDGEFLYKNGQSLLLKNERKYKNDQRFLTQINEFAKVNNEFVKTKNQNQDEINKNIENLKNDLDKGLITKENYKNSLASMDPLKKETLRLKKELDKNIENLKNKLNDGLITKEAYKNSVMKLNIFFEEDVKAFKMTLEENKQKYMSKDIFVKYRKENSLIKKEYLQDKNKTSKEVPIEYKKNNSIWMTIIAFFMPGVDSLILKNWKKAIGFLILTILAWAIFIPYAFGAYNIKGDGIMGLVDLSWQVGDSDIYGPIYSDARYSLVEGVIGILLLVSTISYFTISAYQCWKITRSMEKGIRFNTWIETKKILRTSGFPYAISLPGLVLIMFIVIMPIIVSLLLAFTNIGTDHNPAGGQPTNWVGFEQFVELFTNKEFFRPFGHVLWWNIVWAISTSFLVIFLGTVMALAIENRNIKGKTFWRTIFILPWAIPAFVSILFFKVIFGETSNSVVNSLLINMGLEKVNWQTGPIASRIILILIQGWLGHSYIVLLVSGNMKSIPNDIYEASRIDGAKPFKQFAKMTLPIILLQIAPLLISQFTFNFNNFSIIWLFNDGGSKISSDFVYNVGSTDIILSWIYKITFTTEASIVQSNQAIASAMVIVMSIFVVGASGIGFARSRAFRKGEDI